MNLKSEQLSVNSEIVLDYDQKLTRNELLLLVSGILGKENCEIINFEKKKILCYKPEYNLKEILLLANITYMGGNGQHPAFLKRIQLKKWYKEAVNFFSKKDGYNIRFIGVYKYNDNIILVDFTKESYMSKAMHNSAAHIYINDLYQAEINGSFKKIDKNKNEIITISKNYFKEYLDGMYSVNGQDKIFSVLEEFNANFCFDKEITAMSAITEMHNANWRGWRFTEWAGLYLEYKFSQGMENLEVDDVIKYVGDINSCGAIFDLSFLKGLFFGDLKASSELTTVAPGNDQVAMLDYIHTYGKLWYIIYEHETIKDKDFSTEYIATRFRTKLLMQQDGKSKNDLSYSNKMKYSVKFKKMVVI
ncbi:MAG: hypothetical protein JJE17_07900, partial [Peptostreptococcaceae bacterium]|nr:hypothetical protein [Peptostreptococcaceae bacterium]